MTYPENWAARRTSFGSGAASYAVGRPRYPQEIVRWALPENAARALDLGAGTGLLTVGLLELGLEVTAVEPLDEMRTLIPAPAKTLAGSAEAIPVEDSSIDAVLAGQAWHWFDAAKAIVEAHRVLRPGGTIALMWNLLDVDDNLSRGVAEIIEAEERSDMLLDDPTPPFAPTPLFPEPARRVVSHFETYTTDRVLAFAASRSQSILLEPTERDAMFARLRAALPDGEFPLRWQCEVWRAERA
jgi:SAM-dependent methyltransferase